jgi:hypothetical protein
MHWFGDGEPGSNRTVERHCRVLEDDRPQAPISLTVPLYSLIHCHNFRSQLIAANSYDAIRPALAVQPGDQWYSTAF